MDLYQIEFPYLGITRKFAGETPEDALARARRLYGCTAELFVGPVR
jgi:hypothetical protein